MCGAYGFTYTNKKDVYERFEIVNDLEDLRPSWNMHPWRENPVIIAHSPNKITRMYWTLIPRMAKTRDQFRMYATFNAKKENLTTSRFYAKPFRTQRCLIPATHFFEPDKVNFPKGRHPWHCFQLRDRSMFAIAGIYEVWTDPATGKEVFSYTMVTVEPDEVVGAVHPRMAAIFASREDEQAWINPDIAEPDRLLSLLKPFPSDGIEGWQVPDLAKNPRNDGPEVIKPVEDTPQVKAVQERLI